MNYYENLKEDIIDEFQTNYIQWLGFFSSSQQFEYYLSLFKDYVYNKHWDNVIGDTIPLILSKILRIHIQIYVVQENNLFVILNVNFENQFTEKIMIKLQFNHYEAIMVKV